MIKVTVFEDSDRVVRGFKLTGHAGYGEEGQDIVCAAVSALVFSAYNSIETFTEDDFEGSADERPGDFFRRDQSGIKTPYEFSGARPYEYHGIIRETIY